MKCELYIDAQGEYCAKLIPETKLERNIIGSLECGYQTSLQVYRREEVAYFTTKGFDMLLLPEAAI